MRAIVFDTETTGFRPGMICQLAYIVADVPKRGSGEGCSAISARNMYFQVGYMPADAARVHGLTVAALRQLSGGLGFADSADEIVSAFASCGLWVAHNLSFDRSFLLAEIARADRAVAEGAGFCTMRGLAGACAIPSRRPGGMFKWPSLDELAARYGVTESEAQACRDAVFGQPGKRSAARHDASFDAAMTFLCFDRAVRDGVAP